MKITDAFLGEHATLYAQLELLEREASADPDPVAVRAQVRLLAAALDTHAELEDELLFRELEPQLGLDGGPLAVMRMEHEEVKATLDALQSVGPHDDPAPLVRQLVDVARAHFAKEEEVLFPLAESLLGEGGVEAAGGRWAEQRLARRAPF